MGFSIRSGDQVEVIAGKDKGKRGKVTRIYVNQSRVLVEGVNQAKKHVKASAQDPQGGIVDKELPIHVSNVMLIDPKTDKPTRTGKKPSGDKGKGARFVRVSRKSDHVFN